MVADGTEGREVLLGVVVAEDGMYGLHGAVHVGLSEGPDAAAVDMQAVGGAVEGEGAADAALVEAEDSAAGVVKAEGVETQWGWGNAAQGVGERVKCCVERGVRGGAGGDGP